ncbi:hypothetical protein HIM_07996 [Hirsutella minnesotensis 3608]|uniref:Elongin-A n=1 Tax=Hirsutella minnesotensis 3608 TaxID=1043627 RepID=A0A0F7ZYK6_9HYPO|nr:hypothetical protein HIM_07996 [Hirsutella minnesotensis 3608]
MPAKSLMELASAACIKNIKSLESVGDYLPYDSVRHILLRVDNAYQLRQVELNSPQLQGETSELWIKLIERDFPLEYKASAYKPQTADKWHKVWEKYKKEHDAALEESERKLMSALAGLRQDKEKNTSKIVKRKFLPRAGRVGSKRPWGQRDPNGSVLTFNSGSRTRTHTGASVMRRVRREVKEIATIHGSLSRPIRGPARMGSLPKAPPAMINDYQRAAQPQYRTTAKAPPEAISAVEQYEKRATFISDSEEEEADDDASHDSPPRHAASKPAPSVKNQAAQASLLKKRGGLFRGPAPKPIIKSQPASASKPAANHSSASSQRQNGPGAQASSSTKPSSSSSSSSSSLANKFGGARSPTKARSMDRARRSPHSPVGSSSDADNGSPQPRATASRELSPGPSSPPEVVDAPTESAPQPAARKRKAVDIFMRRKKRVA